MRLGASQALKCSAGNCWRLRDPYSRQAVYYTVGGEASGASETGQALAVKCQRGDVCKQSRYKGACALVKHFKLLGRAKVRRVK